MTSQLGKQAIAIHILPNISRSLGNMTMKFDKLIKYNKKKVRRIKYKIFCRPFSKRSKLGISLDQIVFLPCLYIKLKAIEILNLCCRPFALSSFKAFLKKEMWNLSTCPIFDMIFEQEYFSCYILLTNQSSLTGCMYFMRYWAICVLQLFVKQVVM